MFYSFLLFSFFAFSLPLEYVWNKHFFSSKKVPILPSYHLLTGATDAPPYFSVYLRLGLNESAVLKYCEISCYYSIFG